MFFTSRKTDKNHLAVYWAKDSFCLAESTKGVAENLTQVRFDAPVAGDPGQKIPEGLRLTALLQQTIQSKKFVSKKITLSLADKDVIYRSFTIPFMQPEEVKNVVDFEATKYIPIKLEELAYTYHAVPFSEGDQKQLRILFVAARKVILERYTGILQQAGLETEFIEPASVSLIRILQKNNHISRQSTTALIEIDHEGGRIIIADKEVVHFVREFQSSLEGAGSIAENTKLFNDIRVSFNFYQRQNPQGKVDRVLVLATQELTELSIGLGQEFKVPALALTVEKVFKDAKIADPAILCAAGGCVRESALSSKNFDLTIKAAKNIKGAALESAGPLANWDFKRIGISAAISLAIFMSFRAWSTLSLTDATRQSKVLKEKLGIFDGSTKDKMVELRDATTKKLYQYKDVRITSAIADYLIQIPELLPDGAWLGNLSIEYYEKTDSSSGTQRRVPAVAINMDGYAYLPNQNDQIPLINTLITKMRNDATFSKNFANIDLSNVKKEVSGNYSITSFRISCK